MILLQKKCQALYESSAPLLGVNNKECQQCPRSEVSFKRMCNCAVFHSYGVGLAVHGVPVSQRGCHLALPPFSFHCFFSVTGACFLSLVHGGSWLGCSVVPAMGASFSLRAGCQKWNPLDIPGTQPPLSSAVVNI